MDAASAFWQLELDSENSYLCTSSSPFGRYRFLRIPFGISCAAEIYQRVFAEMLEDIPNAEKNVDDILVWGTALEQHEEALNKDLKNVKTIILN